MFLYQKHVKNISYGVSIESLWNSEAISAEMKLRSLNIQICHMSLLRERMMIKKEKAAREEEETWITDSLRRSRTFRRVSSGES